ncbi:MAG: substrate-binding domain-containing protein [Syntrophobacteraceae bacterium]
MSSKTKHLKSLLLLVLAACTLLASRPVFAEEKIRIGGVGSAMGSMKILGEAFEKLHPDTRVIVLRSLGTGGGIRAVAKGAIDVGVAGRPLTEEERKLELSVIEFAKTPLVFAVKTGSPISGLSGDEVIRVIKGDATTWPDGRRARAVLRPVSDVETGIIRTASPDLGLAIQEAVASGRMIVALTAQEAADAIEKTPGAFGISTLSLIQSEGRPLKIVPFDGISPNVKSITDGSYPFVMSYSMLTRHDPSRTVRDFVDFVQSAPGRRILEESGNFVEPREK